MAAPQFYTGMSYSQLIQLLQASIAPNGTLTGPLTIAAPSSGDTLTVSGSSTIGGVVTVSGNANQATGYGANLGIVTSDTGSASRFLFGDGSGWSLAFSKRTGGVTTDLVTIKDAGNVTIAAPSSGNALTVSGATLIAGSAATNNAELDITNTDASGGAWRIGDNIGTAANTLSFYSTTNTRVVMSMKGAGNVTISAPSSGITLTVAQTSGAGKQAGSFGAGLSTCYSVFSGSLCVGTEGGDYPSVGYNWNPQSLGADNYLVTDLSSRLQFKTGGFLFQTAASGTAGNPITWATKMTITQAGNWGINGVSAAQSTNYGTPTGGAKQTSFAAGSITLPNLAAAVAQLIIDLKAFGLLGA